MRKVKVKLLQDGEIHEYNEDIAKRLEASGRCKIIRFVDGKSAISGRSSSRGSGRNSNKDK